MDWKEDLGKTVDFEKKSESYTRFCESYMSDFMGNKSQF